MRESDETLQQTTTHREHFAQHTHKRTRVKQKRDFARPHTDKKLHNSNQQLSEKRMFTVPGWTTFCIELRGFDNTRTSECYASLNSLVCLEWKSFT